MIQGRETLKSLKRKQGHGSWRDLFLVQRRTVVLEHADLIVDSKRWKCDCSEEETRARGEALVYGTRRK